MKKTILTGMTTAIFFAGMLNSASAFESIDASLVGGADLLKASAALPSSGEPSELEFINNYLHTAYTTAQYEQFTDMTQWKTVTSTDWWAYDLHKDGGYFLIKIGNIKLLDSSGSNVASHPQDLLDTFLYQNLTSTNYAVIDYSDLKAAINAALQKTYTYHLDSFDIGKISHVGEFGSPVPVPSSALLLGTSILGLVGLTSRRRNRN